MADSHGAQTARDAEVNIDAMFDFLQPSPNTQRRISAVPSVAAVEQALSTHRTTFAEYAKDNFFDKSPSAHRHSRFRLTRPLLDRHWKSQEVDSILEVWTAILTFLGETSVSEPLSALTLAQIICAAAIRLPPIRDEVYCQLCKCLTENQSKSSTARAWILMAVCCSSFLPTSRDLTGQCLPAMWHFLHYFSYQYSNESRVVWCEH
jgi:hypothetical protein